MPMLLLKGDKKVLECIIKEQRIRIGRGLISITPASEAGLVPEEEVKETFESQQEVIDELSAKNESLQKENDEMKARIAELESLLNDTKDVEITDSKNNEPDDTKEVLSEDEKAAEVQEDKKVPAKKAKK